MNKRSLGYAVLRVVLSGMIFFCASAAWAGAEAYRGLLAFRQGDPVLADFYFDRASQFGPAGMDPSYLYLKGQSLLETGADRKDIVLLLNAERTYRRLVKDVPAFHKAGLLASQAHLWAVKLGYAASPDELDSLKKKIWNAAESQPDSPWMAYTASTTLLYNDVPLTSEERKKAWDLLGKAAQMLPEQYLEPSLDFALKRTGSSGSLPGLIGQDEFSLRMALGYFEKKGLWKLWVNYWPRYQSRRQEEAVRLGLHAVKELEAHRYEQAIQLFRQAEWMDPGAVLPAVGQVIASYLSEDRVTQASFEVLQRALEEESDLGSLGKYLGSVTERSRNPYLQGLWAAAAGKDPQTIEQMSASPEGAKYRLYYLANALAADGEGEKARSLLMKGFQESDLGVRALGLLFELDPGNALVNERLQQLKSSVFGVRDWQSSVLDGAAFREKGEAGIVVSLVPGSCSLCFSARLKTDSREGGALRVRLGSQILGAAYVTRERWQPVCFKTQTPGGKYWFSVELMNELRPAALELGSLKVNSLGKSGAGETGS